MKIVQTYVLLIVSFLVFSSTAKAEVRDSLRITELGAESLNIVYKDSDSARLLINEALVLSHQTEHIGLLGLT